MKASGNFDYNIESLRGFSAISVVIGHIIYYKRYFDTTYFPIALSKITISAHLSVLLFFVLSGYVIGLRNNKGIKTKDILSYLKKRVLRLYPIYIICILFTLLIVPYKYSLGTILGNLFFLQVIVTPVIFEINPIWSLHYEVLFYLIFVPISFFSLNSILIVICSFALGIINYLLFPDNAFFTTFCFGLCFWYSGVIIARYFPYKENISGTNYNLLLSNIFLLLSLERLNTFNMIFSKISIFIFNHNFEFPNSIEWAKKAVSFSDFSFLPYCVYFILTFSGKLYPYKKQTQLFFQFLPIISIFYILQKSNNNSILDLVTPLVFYGISTLLFFTTSCSIHNISEIIIQKGGWFGGLSYAIYLFHFPLMALFHRIDTSNGMLIFYILKLIIYITIVIVVSVFLEKKYQPWITLQLKNKLSSNINPSPSPVYRIKKNKPD